MLFHLNLGLARILLQSVFATRTSNPLPTNLTGDASPNQLILLDYVTPTALISPLRNVLNSPVADIS